MFTMEQKPNFSSDIRAASPPQRYSTKVKFINEVDKEAPKEPPTSVEIFSIDDKWYCQVRRGEQMTQPIGPYTKLQAEQIQDARRMSIAKGGAARLVFERVEKD
jgi:hypothetical protein